MTRQVRVTLFLLWATTGALAADRPKYSPITDDDGCEFGHWVVTEKYAKHHGLDPTLANNGQQYITHLLKEAATYCKNGDAFMIGESGGNWQLDSAIYNVAVRLCRRPEIQEKRPSASGYGVEYRCKITKIDELRAKMSKGEPLYVPPQPEQPAATDSAAPKSGAEKPAPAVKETNCAPWLAAMFPNTCGTATK